MRSALSLVAAILCLLEALGCVTLAEQTHFKGFDVASVLPSNHDIDWEWDSPLAANETGHLVFNSINFLLQHWPNIRYRNGHTIIPGVILPGTLLYHGSSLRRPPRAPEWVSFDPEHAAINIFGPVLQTYAVNTGGLKVLYFDGNSAGKMPSGTMDTQEILAHGEIRELGWISDRKIIAELCGWASEFGIGGFIRMEFDFEVMVCDFLQDMTLISLIDIIPATPVGAPPPGTSSHPGSPTKPTSNPLPSIPYPIWPEPSVPTGWKGSLRTAGSILLEVVQAANWRSTAPGLPGVDFDYAGAISFFDPRYRSLVEGRKNVTKREAYRAGWASKADIELMKEDLRTVLTRNEGGSGVKWKGIMRSVEERYAMRLQALAALLHDDGSTFNLTSTIFHARNAILVMLTPFLDVNSTPSPDSTNSTWIAPALYRCAMTHTEYISPPAFTLTTQEKLLKRSVEVVLREICRTLGRIWIDAFDTEVASKKTHHTMLEKWKGHVDDLMEWLGWAIWTTCDPPCGPLEMCSPPQWPFDLGMWRGWRGEDNYTPTCISRFGGSVWRDIPDGK